MKPIRASEIGSYLYCRRAWWYQQQGIAPENKEELEAGQAFHHRHARAVFGATFMRLIAWALLLLALILIVGYCTAHI